MTDQRSDSWKDFTFRQCVHHCASDQRMVERFNREFGSELPVPIGTLLNQVSLNVSAPSVFEDQCHVALFILFVYKTVWPHVLFARTRHRFAQAATARPSELRDFDKPAAPIEEEDAT